MKQYLKTAGLSVALAAVASIPVSAEVAINEYLFVDGYASVAATVNDVSGPGNQYSLFNSGKHGNSFDQVKFGIRGKYQDFGGYISTLYTPGGDTNEAGILDAYVNWSKDGLTITLGKFLSSLGYESFYPIYTTQISYSLVSGIPGYHSGVKAEYAADKFTVGAAVVDSLQSDPNDFNQGDGSLSEVGFEAYVSYTGIDKLTVFLGLGFDTGDESGPVVADGQFIADLWASYAATDKLTLAAEIAYAEDVSNFSWLALAKYSFTNEISAIARVSGREGAFGEGDAYKFTVSPTYTLNKYLSFRTEFSYTKRTLGERDEYFYGAQALFQF